jgi:hypothetical protein
MDNLIAQDAYLIEICPDDLAQRLFIEADNFKVDREVGMRAMLYRAADRIEQLEREKAVVSDLWEQQKQIALDYLADCNKAADHIEAQCRAIEQHEAFKQEVSDAITALLDRFVGDSLSQGVINGHLHSFIIRKPDPLVEVIKAMRDEPTPYVNSEVYANRIHKKLDALGFEIREKGQ